MMRVNFIIPEKDIKAKHAAMGFSLFGGGFCGYQEHEYECSTSSEHIIEIVCEAEFGIDAALSKLNKLIEYTQNFPNVYVVVHCEISDNDDNTQLECDNYLYNGYAQAHYETYVDEYYNFNEEDDEQ